MEIKENLAVVYCRVSTDDQADLGLSLEVQQDACVNRVKDDGLALLKVIRDEGISASSMKRPGIQEIISLVTDQKIAAVYALDSSRISRNTMEYLCFRDLLRKHNVRLAYINQPNMDDSAMSRTMDTVMASFNQMHSLVTSEKVKKTIAAKIEAGYFPTIAPIGYKNVIDPNATSRLAKRTIVPDEMAPLVSEAFNLYATGDYSGIDLMELLYSKGLRTKKGRKLSVSRFFQMLRNQIYYGELRWAGLVNPNGKHLPLTDKRTFEQVQMVLAGHNYHACRKRKYQWLLNGFVYCPVHQRRFTAEFHFKKQSYYHCSNRFGCGKHIQTRVLEQMVAEKFKDLEFNPEFVELVIEKVKAIFYNRREEYNAKRQSHINKRKSLEAKLSVAQEKLFSKVLSDEEFTKVRGEVTIEIQSLEDRLRELEAGQDVHLDIAQEVIRFTNNIYDTYKKAPLNLKRHYLAFFWDRFEVEQGVIINSRQSLLFKELLRLQQTTYTPKKTKKLKNITGIEPRILTPVRGA